ncbi:hypothetical protein HY626_04295 [Candidatus Uhrbacteria bacterium]|nr:hypothetical protein [Candidatus Uhrbacteria bacterium]
MIKTKGRKGSAYVEYFILASATAVAAMWLNGEAANLRQNLFTPGMGTGSGGWIGYYYQRMATIAPDLGLP